MYANFLEYLVGNERASLREIGNRIKTQ